MVDVVNTCANGISHLFCSISPPMLPEDVRYMELTDADLSALGQRLRLGKSLRWRSFDWDDDSRLFAFNSDFR